MPKLGLIAAPDFGLKIPDAFFWSADILVGTFAGREAGAPWGLTFGGFSFIIALGLIVGRFMKQ